jgi:hypothetical protein
MLRINQKDSIPMAISSMLTSRLWPTLQRARANLMLIRAWTRKKTTRYKSSSTCRYLACCGGNKVLLYQAYPVYQEDDHEDEEHPGTESIDLDEESASVQLGFTMVGLSFARIKICGFFLEEGSMRGTANNVCSGLSPIAFLQLSLNQRLTNIGSSETKSISTRSSFEIFERTHF